MVTFLFRNLETILSGIVIPALAVFILLAFRWGKGYYSSGLDIIAGIAGLDFGLLALSSVLKEALSPPFKDAAALLFITFGLMGMLFFVALLPVERALTRYGAQSMSTELGCHGDGRGLGTSESGSCFAGRDGA